jgi:hypothetical protein
LSHRTRISAYAPVCLRRKCLGNCNSERPIKKQLAYNTAI